ncbi:MAG: GIY-YIG nuclease family protein [Bacteroidales bacterium]|nr:GIY-YIG nuclease family protein [Bacteroidales bacterium]
MKYVIVDIETTGGNAKSGKIIEIAAYLLENNEIIDEFVSLINPERNIPPFISNMTGITSEMLEDAPKFYEIAKCLVEITEDAVFVAHNVSFDYSFIAAEFARLGYHWQKEKICTVQQSRKIFPGFPSYSLGKLCESLKIPLEDRHRAAGDARATAILFQKILKHGIVKEKELRQLELKLHPKLMADRFSEIPDTPGVYYFLNDKEDILYIGKSKNLRKRVLSHFYNKKSSRSQKIQSQTARVEFEETGSELIALLKESAEIKSLKPLYNRAGRRSLARFGIYMHETQGDYIQLSIESIHYKNKKLPLSSFPEKDSAKRYLERLIQKHELCSKFCSLSNSESACFNYQIKRCKGACVGEEIPESYNERVFNAIDDMQMKDESFMLLEGSSPNGRPFVLIENGVYIGFGYLDPDSGISTPDDCLPYISSNNVEDRQAVSIIQSYMRKNPIQKISFVKESHSY